MSLDSPQPINIDTTGFRFGIVASRFNQTLVDALIKDATNYLNNNGVSSDCIEIIRVPGSYEIPFMINRLAVTKNYNCLIALGLLIKGDTQHHSIVGESVTGALLNISIQQDIPVINGVVITESNQQAKDRCTGDIKRGGEFAQVAIEMAELSKGEQNS